MGPLPAEHPNAGPTFSPRPSIYILRPFFIRRSSRLRPVPSLFSLRSVTPFAYFFFRSGAPPLSCTPICTATASAFSNSSRDNTVRTADPRGPLYEALTLQVGSIGRSVRSLVAERLYSAGRRDIEIRDEEARRMSRGLLIRYFYLFVALSSLKKNFCEMSESSGRKGHCFFLFQQEAYKSAPLAR